MCGRFAFDSAIEEITEQFSLTQSVVLKPRYNIAPSQLIPVIRMPGKLEFLTWGLRPSWLPEGQNAFTNARMETIHEKPAFRHAFKQRRCLILTNGYYEWKQIGSSKQPYFITLPQQKLFAFGGLWENDTATIITKRAYQPEVLNVHERMPLIIHPEHFATWFDTKTSKENVQLVMQMQNTVLNVFPVSTKVNNPKNDILECTLALQ